MNLNQLKTAPISHKSRHELKAHLEAIFANINAIVTADNPVMTTAGTAQGRPRYVIRIRGEGASRVRPQDLDEVMKRFDVRSFISM